MYRRVTKQEMKAITEELIEAAEADEEMSSDFREGWVWIDLPTGKFPIKLGPRSFDYHHTHWLEHGRRYQEVHAPDKVELVGGCWPF